MTSAPHDILMPAMSSTMSEGKLTRWMKKEGDPVRKGEAIAEIETDKSVVDLEAEHDGIMGSILVPEGAGVVQVGDRLATVLVEIREARMDPDRQRVRASPLARRLATGAAVDLGRITGSGPDGRVVAADVVALPRAQAEASAQTERRAADRPHTVVPHSPMRKTIAHRLSVSKTTVPHFYVTMDCCVDRLLRKRAELKQTGSDYSINDFVIRAAALALRRVPGINASWSATEVRQYHNVDIAVAVATQGGLVTPVIRDADRKNLAAVSSEMSSLAERARAMQLEPAEYEGASLSISNLGMYGVDSFAAIINPPQAAVLAVGAACERAVARGGNLAVANMMTCTLSCDHRVIDGALAAKFLRAVREFVEDPASI